MTVPEFSTLNIEIGDAHQTLLCLVEGKGIIGSVALRHRGRVVAEVARLYVVRERRGRGMGSALLKQCEEIAKASGCRGIGLDVDAERDQDKQREVIEWYMRRDYVCAYQHQDGSIIMSKPL